MSGKEKTHEWLNDLLELPRVALAQLPTPMHRLNRFGAHLDGPEVWIKRDDLTGLAGGGNKTRKLEFLVADAIRAGADTLVTVGAIQSNHTRQTAAAAAKCGMKCALLHCAWTREAGPGYRQAGNILLSSILGADLYLDEQERPIEDKGPLAELLAYLKKRGHQPYLIPGGASNHRLGSMGYMVCAAEIAKRTRELGFTFDYVVHCTGSSSTQSGLVAGFAALGEKTHVIGVSDDDETEIKKARVLRFANDALLETGAHAHVNEADIEIVTATQDRYGIANDDIYKTISLMAKTEGLIIDPVYEGRAVRGLLTLASRHRFEKNSKILIMHLGGTPAVHGYANQFDSVKFIRFPF
jgi:1-aminocyclopropane-1-carboxylate deaminase